MPWTLPNTFEVHGSLSTAYCTQAIRKSTHLFYRCKAGAMILDIRSSSCWPAAPRRTPRDGRDLRTRREGHALYSLALGERELTFGLRDIWQGRRANLPFRSLVHTQQHHTPSEFGMLLPSRGSVAKLFSAQPKANGNRQLSLELQQLQRSGFSKQIYHVGTRKLSCGSSQESLGNPFKTAHFL